MSVKIAMLRLLFTYRKMLFIAAFSPYEVISSCALDITRITLTLALLTESIRDMRTEAPLEGSEGDENEWGFGQMLPIFFLALPLFAILEYFTPDNNGK